MEEKHKREDNGKEKRENSSVCRYVREKVIGKGKSMKQIKN